MRYVLRWTLAAGFVWSILTLSVQPSGAQAGGVQAEGSRFRLIRSVSGSKGAPQGTTLKHRHRRG
jgi:hypothetical protein